MKTKHFLFILVGLSGLLATGGAVTVATPPAGYHRLEAGGGRDNWLSLPLVRRAAVVARISAVGPATLSLAGVELAADAYAPSATGAYYLQFVTGALAGRCYQVLGNTADGVTLATEGDDLGAHSLGSIATGAAGDLVRIRPYWTVAGLLGQAPSALLFAPLAATSDAIYAEGDAILLPDNATLGTEKPPAAVISYVSSQGWRRRGESGIDASGTSIPPGVPFVWRRSGAAVSALLVGYLSGEPGLIRLPALPANGETDVAVALFHPWPRALADSGLAEAIESSADIDHARDLLLSPADTRAGFSIPPARQIHLESSGWFEGTAPADAQTLRYGAGLVVRLRGERPVRYWRQAAPH